MNRFFMTSFLLTLLLFSGLLISVSGQESLWKDDYNQALNISKSQSKPVLIYFFSAKARACYQMNTQTFPDKDVQNLMKDFIPVRVDVSMDAQTPKKYSILKVPTVLLLEPSPGKELGRAIGFKPPEQFRKYLSAALKPSTEAYSPVDELRTKASEKNLVSFSHRAPDAKEVYLAGDFNDWHGKSLLMERSPEGVWHLDLYLFRGTYEYKYVVDGQFVRDLNNNYIKPDNYGGMNSVAVVGNLEYGPNKEGEYVTFLYFNPKAKKVEIAGSFNDWKVTPMFHKGDGTWGIKLKLPKGRYEYKYIVDGNWILDPENFSLKQSGIGTWNSFFEVK